LIRKLVILLFFLCQGYLFAQKIDIRILRAVNSPETLPADSFFKFVSNSDAYIAIGTPIVMGTAGLLKHDDKLLRESCVTLTATAVNAGITAILKYSVNRDRPFITYTDIAGKSGAGSPSFPSGHTSSAFATATSLTLTWPKWYVIIPSFTWAGAVGYSRMHLGVHYPSDVLAGAALGAGSAWITHAVNKRLILKSKHQNKI
jgi:membrane-associated phospholipid phosphatase